MSTETPENLALRREQTEVWLNLQRIARALTRASEDGLQMAGLTDITPAQSTVLMTLFQEKKPLTARQLAGSLEVTEVTVSRFIQTLERNGWVHREPDPDDRRARLVHLTPRATQNLPLLASVSNAVLDLAFSDFDRWEVVQLSTDLARMQSSLSQATTAGGGTST